MSHYDDIRNRIHRQMVPLPILYRNDYSIDHAGLAKYVAWHLENHTQNFCLTFTYIQSARFCHSGRNCGGNAHSDGGCVQ